MISVTREVLSDTDGVRVRVLEDSTSEREEDAGNENRLELYIRNNKKREEDERE